MTGTAHNPIPFERIVRYLRGGQELTDDGWVDIPDRAAAIMASDLPEARIFAFLAGLVPVPLINPAHPHVEPLWRAFVKAGLIDAADVSGIMALAATPLPTQSPAWDQLRDALASRWKMRVDCDEAAPEHSRYTMWCCFDEQGIEPICVQGVGASMRDAADALAEEIEVVIRTHYHSM